MRTWPLIALIAVVYAGWIGRHSQLHEQPGADNEYFSTRPIRKSQIAIPRASQSNTAPNAAPMLGLRL